MGTRWTAPGGWEVQLVQVAGRDVFRVTWWGGWFTGYCRTVEELAALIGDIGGLEETADNRPG